MSDVAKPVGSTNPPASPGGGAGLRRNILSMPEVLTQSVANAAPSAAVSVLPAIAFIYAGNGAWLTFVIATVSMVLIGYSVSIFARRFASAGSFYVYNTKALGSAGGFASGWALVLGYVFTAMATTCGVAIYLGAFLTQIGLPGGTTGAILLMIAIDVAVASWFAYRSIGLSARMSLVLEAVSMSIILVLFAIVFVRKGISTDVLSLKGMPSAGIGPGIVIAIFAFVGFESAASLGLEAKNPYRTVPMSVIVSAVLVGTFYIIGTLAQSTGFEGAKVGFDSAPAPLFDLAGLMGVSWFGYVMNLGITASNFACTLACINAGSRMVYQMGQDGMILGAAGRSHATNQTPHIGIYLVIPLMVLGPFVIILSGHGPLDVINWMGTTATFGFMLAYLLVAIAAPLYLYRRGEPYIAPLVVGIIGSLIMLYVYYASVWPIQPMPGPLWPIIFVAWMIIGFAWYFVVRSRSPHVMAQVGAIHETNEAMVGARR
ncbi:MAG: APC family permease [Chloroflexi bacterium]|nr:MAG: APC family permease [Chloroflexota bacterium]